MQTTKTQSTASKAQSAILMQSTAKYSKAVQLVLLNVVSIAQIATLLNTNVAYVINNCNSVLTNKKNNALLTYTHFKQLQSVILTQVFATLNTNVVSAKSLITKVKAMQVQSTK